MTETSSAASPTAWQLSGFGDEVDPDPAVQAAVMLALGASYIEVRSAWGVNVSELTPGQVAELKEILDAKGLKVSAVASPIGKVDIGLPVEHEVERLRQENDALRALYDRSNAWKHWRALRPARFVYRRIKRWRG